MMDFFTNRFRFSSLDNSPLAVRQFSTRLKRKNFNNLINCKNQKEFEKNANVLAEKILSGNDFLTINCFNQFLDYVNASTKLIAYISKSIYPKYIKMVKAQEKLPKDDKEYILGSIQTLFKKLKSLGFSPTKIKGMKD